VRAHSCLRQQIDSFGVTVHEKTGAARFVDAHTIETERGLRLQADKFIICTGGVSRRLPITGFELTSTHSDAWRLTSVPPSMLVGGAGNTGVQVASVFNASAHASRRQRSRLPRGCASTSWLRFRFRILTYTDILAVAAAEVARQLGLNINGKAPQGGQFLA